MIMMMTVTMVIYMVVMFIQRDDDYENCQNHSCDAHDDEEKE